MGCKERTCAARLSVGRTKAKVMDLTGKISRMRHFQFQARVRTSLKKVTSLDAIFDTECTLTCSVDIYHGILRYFAYGAIDNLSPRFKDRIGGGAGEVPKHASKYRGALGASVIRPDYADFSMG